MGDNVNQLESMLSKETTPPIVCEPRPRALDEDQPEDATKAGQNRYPLVTQAHNTTTLAKIDLSSEQAIHSINALQSTEWAVNLEMVDTRSTKKSHKD